jgi:integrase
MRTAELPRYMFRRGNILYLRLQPPGQPVVEKSLGTSDVKAAEIAAADLIKQHKTILYERRLARLPRLEPGAWAPEYQPGLHDGFFATERQLLDRETGAVIGPNGVPAQRLVNLPMGAVIHFGNPARPVDELRRIGPVFDISKLDRPTPTVKNSDDDLLETYIKHNGLDGLREKQARDIWHIFKTVVKKPLRSCTRDDGRAIVAYMKDQADEDDPPKSATLRRRMVPLVATVNLAIDEGKLTFNPFTGVVPVCDDEDERDPFTDDDMKLIRANLHKLDANDQLLVRLVATTGMRRSEAFAIDRVQIEDGIRFVTIGKKTGASVRRVPLPTDLLPYLPEKITGKLIAGRMDSAGKRLSKWMVEIGIAGIADTDKADTDKAPMHSFRHRAANRLRAAGVSEPVMEAIGGWSDGKKKTSRKYGNKHGRGFPLKMLKEAIDKIGF